MAEIWRCCSATLVTGCLLLFLRGGGRFLDVTVVGSKILRGLRSALGPCFPAVVPPIFDISLVQSLIKYITSLTLPPPHTYSSNL